MKTKQIVDRLEDSMNVDRTRIEKIVEEVQRELKEVTCEICGDVVERKSAIKYNGVWCCHICNDVGLLNEVTAANQSREVY